MADNAAAYFERLTSVLFRHGFDWVVDQAEAEILEGRSVTKEVRTVEYGDLLDVDSFAKRSPRRRPTALMTTVPYDDAERLRILLHGIEAALSQRADLERAILTKLEDVEAIEFAPEEGRLGSDLARRAHWLGRDRLPEDDNLQRNLLRALGELREDADVRS